MTYFVLSGMENLTQSIMPCTEYRLLYKSLV